MAASAQELAYINEVLPYALAEQARTGIPAEVLIVQSGNETGWGTSGWFRNQHNPAGIGVTGAPGAGRVYPNLQAGFDDYADELLKIKTNGVPTIANDVHAGASTVQILQDIERSPWAAGHYGGHGLEQIFAAVYGGGGGPSATHGTGGADAAGSGSSSSSTSSGATLTGSGSYNLCTPSLFGNQVCVPLGGPLGSALNATSAVEGVAADILGAFSNWRYALELLIGVGMILVGVRLVFADLTGARALPSIKAGAERAGQAATVAAMAA